VQDHGQRRGQLRRSGESLNLTPLFEDCERGRDITRPLFFVGLGRRQLALLAAVAACLTACDDPKNEVQYGEPVGIQIAGHGSVPALSVAVAVTKGRDVSATVGSMASAVFTAAAACPAVVATVSAGSVIRLTLAAQANVLHAPAKLSEDPGAACVAHALDGKAITTDRPEVLDIIVEIRADVPDAGRR